MSSYPWRASAPFWIEKIRHIHEILSSMLEHGGFEQVSADWSTASRRECVAELDRLVDVVSAWRIELQQALQDSTQPLDPLPDIVGGIRRTAPQIGTSHPASNVLSLKWPNRSSTLQS